MVMGVGERQGKWERLSNGARAIRLTGTGRVSLLFVRIWSFGGGGAKRSVLLQVLICR